jgi:putative phosphoribosyl transferase
MATHTLEQPATISVESDSVEGTLTLPEDARGVVLFAHGSGSSRHSPRNQFVAQSLQRNGLGTLLIDLLTLHEEHIDAQTAQHRFDIELLADRLLRATDWLLDNSATKNLPIGYFGASTGAAAALVAAAKTPAIAAVVSRGGRPDLARDFLPLVQAPTLLIVGELDYQVIDLNRWAFEQLKHCNTKEISVVPGATHLFEEPGALAEVAALAGRWFVRHLATSETEKQK